MDLKFKRGDKVDFSGGETAIYHNGQYTPKTIKPVFGTFVWAIMAHLQVEYVIEHPDGFPKEDFLAKEPFKDGFEAIHSSELKDGLTYAYVKEETLMLS